MNTTQLRIFHESNHIKGTKMSALIVLLFALSAFPAYAETEQKMVIVKGDKSFLMDGDTYKSAANKPRGYSKDSVLPALLSIGWSIKSIHVNEKSTEDNLYGYVLLQREI